MSTHIVKQGECLSRIAAAYGFADWRRVYEAPENAALREKRPNPNVLFPGDEIVIPQRDQTAEPADTGKTHVFVVKTPKTKLNVRMLDEYGSPMPSERYVADVDGTLYYGETNGDAILSLDLPVDATQAEIWIAGQSRTLRLGELNPIENTPDDGVSGIQGRLRGLGFNPGPIDGKMGPRTRAALLAFQRQYKLTRSGAADAETVARLKKEYRA
jgi:N-acetylmuramoyl-L-alanine amidase